jgi:hypothetical protein
MAIGSLRIPFGRLVAFFKIGITFLQCAHQDAKNSMRTTSDLQPPGTRCRARDSKSSSATREPPFPGPGFRLEQVEAADASRDPPSAGLACQSQAGHKLRV